MSKRILVLAPHPDDEVLGVGGSIAKWASKGNDVYVAILTRVPVPEFDDQISVIARHEAQKVHKLLGVKETILLDLPVLSLEREGLITVNRQITSVMQAVEPDVLLIPFIGDIHEDHKQFFKTALVAARPFYDFAPSTIYTYETLSETNWNAPYITPGFVPNVFVDISDYIDTKIEAIKIYQSQLREFPHERSPETLRALALLRGSTINRNAAEAFVLIRRII